MTPGTDAPIEGTSVRVRFDTVTNDSRCKPGDDCVWEGDATVHFTVGGKAIALHTNQGVNPHAATVQGYRVLLMTLTADARNATILVSKA